MLREKLARNRVGEEEGFAWRGVEVSRIEGLSDAVFAFAITLLVVSLEVPKTFDELLVTMRGFFAFAICFALLFAVWNEHYKFSRRYGLWDASTVRLNAALLFIVLLYVYPLKFLFTILIDELLGFSTDVRLPNGDVVEAIEPGQFPLLMVIYGAGFIAIQVVFVLLYLRAYASRDTLELDASEILITRQEIQGFLLMTAVGLVSVAVAVFGGQDAASWAGLAYLLLFPLQAANGYLMRSRRRSNAPAERATATREEPDDR
jgi:uncharacterized membrane protein